ncbi:MAG: hypothetical protein V4446_01615 [Pseudomonadota bacterium]
MTKFLQRSTLLILALSVLNLAGCATPANRDNMSAPALTVSKKYPYSVAVETRGGSETGAMDSSNISNADLKAAIENSIVQSGLFKNVVQGKTGDYDLTVSVTQISKPIFGASFTVDLETAWSLVKTSDKSYAMRKVIKSSYTATMGDSLVGMTRLRLAVEGAARDNIAQGLKAIADLNL